MRILITGIAGFVGASLARELLKAGHEIIGVDDLSSGYLERINEISSSISLHLGTVEEELEQINISCDAIINCAATAPLPKNEIDHYQSIRNNVATCGSVMQFASRSQVRKVIHFSSSAVYEGIQNGPSNPLSEGLRLQPKLMYPLSKMLSEQYVASQAQVHKIETFSLRLFNLYGPHQDYFRKQPPLLGYLLKNLIRKTTASIYGAPGCRRDYVNIKDLTNFIEILLSVPPKNNYYEAINVGSGQSFDVFELIELLTSVTGETINYERRQPKKFWEEFQVGEKKTINLPVDLLEAEVHKVAYADLSLARAYGFNPMVDIETGLLECFKMAKEYLQ